MLDLSKIEAGRMDMVVERFGVPELIADLVGTIGPAMAKNGNELAVFNDSVEAMTGDLTKVRQCLLNLLSNAAKFTANGMVTLSVCRRGEWIEWTVEDTGIGIAADQIGRLFQAFSQGDASTTRRYGGTGLGLALSRKFARLMGGDISVTSEEGKGTRFVLQVRCAEVGAAPGERTKPAWTASLAEESGRDLVLVVDDDPSVLDLASRVLGRHGFRVATARDGREGIAKAGELRPAVITLDVIMPGMDGWSMLAGLKGIPELAGIPVILHTVTDERELAFVLGAADYLCKPVDAEKLAAAVKKHARPVGAESLTGQLRNLAELAAAGTDPVRLEEEWRES